MGRHVCHFAWLILSFSNFGACEDIYCSWLFFVEVPGPKLRAPRSRFAVCFCFKYDLCIGIDVPVGCEVILYMFFIKGMHFDLAVVYHKGVTVIDLRGLFFFLLDSRVQSPSLLFVTV